jgi:hypothetical protein
MLYNDEAIRLIEKMCTIIIALITIHFTTIVKYLLPLILALINFKDVYPKMQVTITTERFHSARRGKRDIHHFLPAGVILSIAETFAVSYTHVNEMYVCN